MHRLDLETSGVLLLAKDKASATSLQKEFEGRRVQKTYLAVCAVMDEKDDVSTEDLDRYDLFGDEDVSVRALMYDELLPFATGSEFTYRHSWTEGDLVVWDNLRTIHTATPFDERYDREMWRTTMAHETGGEAYLGASIG